MPSKRHKTLTFGKHLTSFRIARLRLAYLFRGAWGQHRRAASARQGRRSRWEVNMLEIAASAKEALWHSFGYSRGTEIFGQAEPADYVCQIKSGSVRTFRLLPDGRRQISAVQLPGDIFGVESGNTHRLTAEAILETQVRFTRRERVCLRSPEILVLPMCRHDVADYLGLSHETVTRCFSILRDQEILAYPSRSSREIILHDKAKLAQLANGHGHKDAAPWPSTKKSACRLR